MKDHIRNNFYIQNQIQIHNGNKNNNIPKTNSIKINCYKCAHFFITWEKNTPYGCRGHGFKSAIMPSIVVFQSSGMPCMLFLTKK